MPIEELGGQAIELGRGRGHLNVLDPGEAVDAAARLRASGHDKEAAQVMAGAHGRRNTIVAALLTILRAAPPTDREETILDRALKALDDTHEGVPVLADLLEVIRSAPDRRPVTPSTMIVGRPGTTSLFARSQLEGRRDVAVPS